ncbi:peptidylprolyl isomerase [Aquimarina sp. W85]|uniref:peptidylprolyl isomerase n=1 Tax=Aquimarina rhodophyticola TaxID=3342246 RepID=UPI00366F8FEB
MSIKKNLIVSAILLSSIVWGQEESAILLTINEEPVYAQEFKSIYLKNKSVTPDSDTLTVDQYLELFTHYKLKIKEAQRLGLDKKKSYLAELTGYEKQLRSNFMSDTAVTLPMLKEAYERYRYRIKAKHILRTMDASSTPSDTLKVYKHLMSLRDSINNGADFEAIAIENSEDPSVKVNFGDLGWFSVFSMVYPFETAAYTTPLGAVSMPFRTSFGYHIVQPIAKEEVSGYITVSDILIKETPDRTEKQAQKQIEILYKQYKNGVSFETLFNAYSENNQAKILNGITKPFKKGGTNSEIFENIAFSLDTVGAVSKPFKTNKGWHIIKVIDKQPIESFEKIKSKLRSQIKKDDRSKMEVDSFSEKLLKKYNISIDEQHIIFFDSITATTAIQDITLSKKQAYTEVFVIGTKKILYRDFINFLKNVGVGRQKGKDFIKKQFRAFQKNEALVYYSNNLESENSEYAAVLNEYRNGLLLFDLMESKIWDKAQNDTVGLKAFYLQHTDQYQQDKRYRVIKASSVDKSILQTIKNQLHRGIPLKQINEKVNTNDIVPVIFDEIVQTAKALPFKIDQMQSVGNYTITEEKNYFTLLFIKEQIPSRTLSLEEIKGIVVNDYQTYLEKQWLNSLQKRYDVKINSTTLRKLKIELEN